MVDAAVTPQDRDFIANLAIDSYIGPVVAQNSGVNFTVPTPTDIAVAIVEYISARFGSATAVIEADGLECGLLGLRRGTTDLLQDVVIPEPMRNAYQGGAANTTGQACGMHTPFGPVTIRPGDNIALQLPEAESDATPTGRYSGIVIYRVIRWT